MKMALNRFIDQLSEYFAHRKGLLPFLGALFVLVNGVLQFISIDHWLISSNLFLHLGVIIAILGFLLARAL